MFDKLFTTLEGKKTYGMSILGIVIGIAGNIWGPFNVAGIEIPHFTQIQILTTLWGGGLFSALHAKKLN